MPSVDALSEFQTLDSNYGPDYGIGSGGTIKVFWSNGLVGSITTLAIMLLFWPVLDKAFNSVGRLWRPATAEG